MVLPCFSSNSHPKLVEGSKPHTSQSSGVLASRKVLVLAFFTSNSTSTAHPNVFKTSRKGLHAKLRTQSIFYLLIRFTGIRYLQGKRHTLVELFLVFRAQGLGRVVPAIRSSPRSSNCGLSWRRERPLLPHRRGLRALQGACAGIE